MAATDEFQQVANAYILPEAKNNPKFWPCTHILCQKCQEERRKRNGGKSEDSVKCKFCHFRTAMPLDADLDAYHKASSNLTSRFLEFCLHFSESTIPCAICSLESHCIQYCKECGKHLCYSCGRGHDLRGHEVSELLSHISSDLCYSPSDDRHLEICCIGCQFTCCIVCFAESDVNAAALLRHVFETDKENLSMIAENLHTMKTLSIEGKENAFIAEKQMRKEINEENCQLRKRQDMDNDHLNQIMTSKRGERMKREQQLDPRLQSLERKLNATTRKFGNSNFDFYTWQRLRIQVMELESESVECKKLISHRTHLIFKASNIHDLVEGDNIIGTIEEVEDNGSDDSSENHLRRLEEFDKDDLKNANSANSASTVGKNRLDDGARTFEVMSHINKDVHTPIKVLVDLVRKTERYLEMLEKLISFITGIKLGRPLPPIIGKDADKLNDAFNFIGGSMSKLFPEIYMQDWQIIKNLHDTLISVCSKPILRSGDVTQTQTMAISKIESIKTLLNLQMEKLGNYSCNIYSSRPNTREEGQQRLLPQSQLATLANLGNTCFLNVIVQVLCHTNVFVKLLRERFPISAHGRNAKGGLAAEFTNLFCSMLSSGGRERHYFPTDLFDALKIKLQRFTDLDQHDCHDLMIHLLNKIRQEEREDLGINSSDRQRNMQKVKDYDFVMQPHELTKMLTVVDKVFSGHILTAYVCTECLNPYHICEPFLDLSLPISEYLTSITSTCKESLTDISFYKEILQNGNEYQKAIFQAMRPFNGSDTEMHGTLENALISSLEHFTRWEFIDSEYLCTTCNAKKGDKPIMTSAAKRTLIYNPPAILIIHLKRFQQASIGTGFVKNDVHIKFSYDLDIAPFCSLGCLNSNLTHENIWYLLYAVVVHMGSLSSGHYVVYIMTREDEPNMKDYLQKEFLDRNAKFGEDELIKNMNKIHRIRKKSTVKPDSRSGTWYRLSDSSCEVVQGKSQGKIPDEVLRQRAYMLFYERVPTT